MGQESVAPQGRLAAIRAWWDRKRLPIRLALVGATGASVAAVLMVVIMVTGGEAAQDDAPPPIAIATETPTPTTEPEPPDTPAPTATPTATVPPQRDPVASMASDLRQFINDFGYPDNAEYAVLRVPVIGVEARVSDAYVPMGAAMPDPVGPAHVVWYDMSEYRTMGGVPGEGGNAIFSAHVDYNWWVPYADVNYDGHGIFYDLRHLEEGDLIEVDYNGETLQYVVQWREQFSATPGATDWGEVWRSTEGVDEITIYTCDGNFNPATARYDDRVVIRAERV